MGRSECELGKDGRSLVREGVTYISDFEVRPASSEWGLYISALYTGQQSHG
jgi:hypothetical protein